MTLPVLISNPENRRTQLFLVACKKMGVEVKCVSWANLLSNSPKAWDSLIGADWIRIESPGENSTVELALIRSGATLCEQECPTPAQHGEIRDTHLWFAGFAATLLRIEEAGGRFMTPPHAIIDLFDKHASHQVMSAGNVPRPPYYGLVESWEDLRQRVREAGTNRVFAKLRFGSSASGVLAIRLDSNRVDVQTSVELENSPQARLFNNLKLRRYRDERTVALIVNKLAPQGLVLEEWVPKGALGRKTADLRVFCVGGSATHVVVRTSDSPITNLHLGNARGSLDALKASLGEQVLKNAMSAALLAHESFPAHTLGVDVAFDPTGKTQWVLEANAFGDLLPGLLDEQGRDTYLATLQEWCDADL